mmetsp:Transcript_17666/g.54756  ORF Transcript_17666/g.54756 Transcript_17666/m.54756 type:complete len:112 (+) Transcript_17666:132-467(+)
MARHCSRQRLRSSSGDVDGVARRLSASSRQRLRSASGSAGGGLARQNGASCDAAVECARDDAPFESARAPRTAADAPRTARVPATSFLAPRRPMIVARRLAKSVGTAMRAY